MSLTGDLSEYSIGEIFNFVQQGNQTGLLSIVPDYESDRVVERTSKTVVGDRYYVAFQGGRIMSVTTQNSSQPQNLLKTIEQRQWLTATRVRQLESQLHLLKQPLGNYLKSLDLIKTEQLLFIFNSQVIANICKMFVEVHRGRFKFDTHASLAYGEMTGLSVTAKQATLIGLRLMRDWSDLATKLPAAESTLQRLTLEPVGVTLERQETEVWKLAVGEMSIAKIARDLGLETSRVQQIGFRLSTIGLAHEVAAPIQPTPGTADRAIATKLTSGGSNHARAAVSHSFLGNLMSFLKQKG